MLTTLLPSDESIIAALPEVEAVVHIGRGDIARFHCGAVIHILSSLGREADEYRDPRMTEAVVPTMSVHLGDDPMDALRNAMMAVSKHGKVTIVVRDGCEVPELGFVSARTLSPMNR